MEDNVNLEQIVALLETGNDESWQNTHQLSMDIQTLTTISVDIFGALQTLVSLQTMNLEELRDQNSMAVMAQTRARESEKESYEPAPEKKDKRSEFERNPTIFSMLTEGALLGPGFIAALGVVATSIQAAKESATQLEQWLDQQMQGALRIGITATGIAAGIVARITGAWNGIGNMIKSVGSGLLGITRIITTRIPILGGMVDGFLRGIGGLVNSAGRTIGRFFNLMAMPFRVLSKVFAPLLAITLIVDTAMPMIKAWREGAGILGIAWAGLKGLAESIYDTFVGFVRGIGWLAGKIAGVFDKFILQPLANMFGIGEAYAQVADAISMGWDMFKQGIGFIHDGIKDFFANFSLPDVVQWFRSLGQGILDGLGTVWSGLTWVGDNIKAGMSDWWAGLQERWSNFWGMFNPLSWNIISDETRQAWYDNIKGGIDMFKNLMSDIYDRWIDFKDNLISGAKGWIEYLSGGLVKFEDAEEKMAKQGEVFKTITRAANKAVDAAELERNTDSRDKAKSANVNVVVAPSETTTTHVSQSNNQSVMMPAPPRNPRPPTGPAF